MAENCRKGCQNCILRAQRKFSVLFRKNGLECFFMFLALKKNFGDWRTFFWHCWRNCILYVSSKSLTIVCIEKISFIFIFGVWGICLWTIDKNSACLSKVHFLAPEELLQGKKQFSSKNNCNYFQISSDQFSDCWRDFLLEGLSKLHSICAEEVFQEENVSQ